MRLLSYTLELVPVGGDKILGRTGWGVLFAAGCVRLQCARGRKLKLLQKPPEMEKGARKT